MTPMIQEELLPYEEIASPRSANLYQRKVGTIMYAAVMTRPDVAFAASRLARDDWGRATHFALQQAFYIRSHWLRMPPVMLARHLWTKWRKR